LPLFSTSEKSHYHFALSVDPSSPATSADVLNARVYPLEHREIGRHQMRVTEAARKSDWFGGINHAIPFHWHGDTFDIPGGATRMASSVACENPAYVSGDHVLGLQFHCESTPESIDLLLKNGADDLEPGKFVQDQRRSGGDRMGQGRVSMASWSRFWLIS